jgi:hypothetical protein
MKNSILLFGAVIITFSLMAYGSMNWNNDGTSTRELSTCNPVISESGIVNSMNKEDDLELFYNVRNRWSTMTKEDLNKVESIFDILREDPKHARDSFRNVRVDILDNDRDVRDVRISEMGQSEILNKAQLELLHSLDYSTNVRISALDKKTNVITGEVIVDSVLHYMTIIPEQEAEFKGGFEVLIQYLKESTKEKAAFIEKYKLQPGKVFFTVTKNGAISNVEIIATSGYPSVDKELVNTITNMPRKWNPAANSKGENVDQEFVFFFGSEGC